MSRKKPWPDAREEGRLRRRLRAGLKGGVHPPHRLAANRLRSIAVAPTLCTLSNLVAGFAALHYSAKPEAWAGPWGWSGLTFAGLMVFLGIFLDAIDGSIARLTRSTSDLGAQLDSLADVITFGVAPAYLTLQLVSRYVTERPDLTLIGPEADNLFGKAIWVAAATYVACAALRLARFNVEVGPGRGEKRPKFRGLPSPGAAGAVASLVLLHQYLVRGGEPIVDSLAFARLAAFGIPLVALLCAAGMVSSIPYVHLSNRFIRGSRSFGYVVWMVLLLLLGVSFFWVTVAVICTGYALSGPVIFLAGRGRRPPEPAAGSESHADGPDG